MTSTVQKAIIGCGIMALVFLALWLLKPVLWNRKLPPPPVLQQKIVQSPAAASTQSGNGNSAGQVPTQPNGSFHEGPMHSTGNHPTNSGDVGTEQQPALAVPVDEAARQAARDLIQHGRNARGVAGRTLEQYRGNDPEVLIALIQATAKAGDWESVPRLVELMEHPDVRVRGKAGAAVCIIMGADYGFRAEDPPQKRREAIRLINQIYPTMKKKLEQHYGSTPPK